MKKQDLAVLILAAGKGERMRSDRPKVLHPLSGKPLLAYVLETVKQTKPKKLVVLVGHKAKEIQNRFVDEKIIWAEQRQPLGTAHAVICGLNSLKSFHGALYIQSGDVPFVTLETIQKMQELLLKEEASLVLLTTKMSRPTGYGRILRNARGWVERIVEEKDADEKTRKIQEINAGIYLCRIDDVKEPLTRIKKNVLKGEYYLTDLVEELHRDGKKVISASVEDSSEVMGINSQEELARADHIFQKKIKSHWMEQGVTMVMPDSIYVESSVTLTSGVTLYPGVVLSGQTTIDGGAEIFAYSVIEDSFVGSGSRIGPFAHLRPGSRVEEGAHVGNFVELKKTRLGKGAKANHLAYLGDAVVGDRSNIGAGTITCNYDGFAKHQTIVGEDCFIGSDTQLVAPVKLGKKSWVGAGTTVTKNVPPGALAVSRIEQMNIPNWRKRKK